MVNSSIFEGKKVQTKLCRKCEQNFPATLEFFYKNAGGKFGLSPRCKSCVNADNTASHAKRLATTPEHVRALANARAKRSYYKDLEKSRTRLREHGRKRLADPEKREEIYARKRGGGARLSVETLNELLETQGGKCAICSTTEPQNQTGSRGWNVDHCHTSGQVRFILCNHCNRGLGAFRDSPTLLRKAADLLEQFKETYDGSVSTNHSATVSATGISENDPNDLSVL